MVLWLFAPEVQLCALLFCLVPRVFLTVCLNFGLIKLGLCACIVPMTSTHTHDLLPAPTIFYPRPMTISQTLLVSGHLREVIAYDRWSHREVQLYYWLN